MVHVFCKSSYRALHLCEASWKYRANIVEMAIFNIFYVQRTASKSRLIRVMFLCSACCLKVLYICEKFHNNILNGFQLTELTQVHVRNDYVQRAITPNVGKNRVRFMCSACRLLVLYICVKTSVKISRTVSELWSRHEWWKGWRTLKISEGIT